MYYTRYAARAAAILAGLALLGMASITAAEETTAPAQAMIIEINKGGNILLRGTVSSVGSSTLAVKSWGGTWNIIIGGSTTIMPHESAINNLSDVKTGDFIGVQGIINSSAPWTVDAKLIRDWTSRKVLHEETKTNMQAIRSTEKTGRENGIGRIFEGKASTVKATSFTLTTAGGSIYTVNVSSATKLVDKAFHILSALTLMQAGDHIRIFGTASSTVITPQVVRDTSVPH